MNSNSIQEIIHKSEDRFALWANFINAHHLKKIAEIGVYRGVFAANLLQKCEAIEEYNLVDPWKNLDNWNKPANVSTDKFESFYNETMERIDFAKNKCIVHRGKTVEVVKNFKDASLDLAYIDGDHTLKGITLDLISYWSKIKQNGFIAGDDFSPTIWQHHDEYEPTLIFPFAVYFAEAVNAPIYGLPYNQFLIIKNDEGFSFTDLAGGAYKNLGLLSQFKSKPPKKKSPLLNNPILNKLKRILKN